MPQIQKSKKEVRNMNQEVLNAKKAVVEEITKNAKESGSIVICEYRGLTVAQLTALRHLLREKESSLNVYKNSLVERAVDALGYNELNDCLEGPNAIIFLKDPLNGLSVVTKFARLNEEFVIKGGVVDGQFATADQIKVLAKLPGREGLLSMFLSCL